ncbi:MAG: transglutaminase-like domain-containing protein, partial [Candidatus Parabeggiatoa sp.]|nr:transglutaminase-like domain-containing protein [Candidatus Parabeggiatoa sp.]
KRLKKKADLSTSRQIFNWVAGHIQYAGYIRENRGALYALTEKRGDCTEYMYLFTALARVNEIPARGIGGYISSEDGLLKSDEYHNWAEFYLEGKWTLADPQNKVFMDKQSNYIAMRIISEQSNLGQSHRFWYLGEGLSVRMN